MKIFRTVQSIQDYLQEARCSYKNIGFVPTMGALHQGHLSLYKKSIQQCELTVASIFVNPIQFNNKKDLELYPRDEEKDIRMLESVGCDVLFIPTVEEIYPTEPTIKFQFGDLETVMEGKYRQGHFSGVAIVVSKLFNIIQPNTAFFGQKDLQQFLIIQKLVEELSFPIVLRCCEIERELSGLAMSSRNVRIPHERLDDAAKIHQLLLSIKKYIQVQSWEKIDDAINLFKHTNKNLELEYVEIVDASNLMNFDRAKPPAQLAVCIACYLAGVRLIDNVLVNTH